VGAYRYAGQDERRTTRGAGCSPETPMPPRVAPAEDENSTTRPIFRAVHWNLAGQPILARASAKAGRRRRTAEAAGRHGRRLRREPAGARSLSPSLVGEVTVRTGNTRHPLIDQNRGQPRCSPRARRAGASGFRAVRRDGRRTRQGGKRGAVEMLGNGEGGGRAMRPAPAARPRRPTGAPG